MGMYTEIYINVDLKEETSLETVEMLCSIIKGEEGSRPLCYCMSYYTPHTQAFYCEFDEISKQWSILFKGDLKNYNNEIENFIEKLTPHVESYCKTFIGYKRYEECEEPELLYVGESIY